MAGPRTLLCMLSFPYLDAMLEPELLVQQAADLNDQITHLRSSSAELTPSVRARLWDLKTQWIYAVFRADMLTAHRSVQRKRRDKSPGPSPHTHSA